MSEANKHHSTTRRAVLAGSVAGRAFREPAVIDFWTNNNPRCKPTGWRAAHVGTYFRVQYKDWRFYMRLLPAGGWTCEIKPPMPQPWNFKDPAIARPYYTACALANPLTAKDEAGDEYGYRVLKGTFDKARAWVMDECRKIHAGEDPLSLPANVSYLPAVRVAATLSPEPAAAPPPVASSADAISLDDMRAIVKFMCNTDPTTRPTRATGRAVRRFVECLQGRPQGDLAAANSNRAGDVAL